MRICPIPAHTLALLFVVTSFSFSAEPEKPSVDDEDQTPFLTLRLVDEQGKPVAGAQAGIWVIVDGFDDKLPGEWNFRYGGTADANGIVRFQGHEAAQRFSDRRIVYVRHSERHLVGVQYFSDDETKGIVTLTLYPECHVRWPLKCTPLEQSGKELGRVKVLTNFRNQLCGFFVSGSTFHGALPPGKFMLDAIGDKFNSLELEIEIKPGVRELTLDAGELPIKKFLLLEGKPAPELEDILEWKNGPPLKLAELRGKVVLLEFWGWWCGPCVALGIPQMFELQEEYGNKDLVIIGVHTPGDETDQIDTVAKLDAQLAGARERYWKGKDITFPVALSRLRKGTYYAGGPEVTGSKACFDYGVDRFPTALLIDRNGNLVGPFDAAENADRARLKRLLELGR